MHAMNKESPSIKVLKGKGMDAEFMSLYIQQPLCVILLLQPLYAECFE